MRPPFEDVRPKWGKAVRRIVLPLALVITAGRMAEGPGKVYILGALSSGRMERAKRNRNFAGDDHQADDAAGPTYLTPSSLDSWLGSYPGLAPFLASRTRRSNGVLGIWRIPAVAISAVCVFVIFGCGVYAIGALSVYLVNNNEI